MGRDVHSNVNTGALGNPMAIAIGTGLGGDDIGSRRDSNPLDPPQSIRDSRGYTRLDRKSVV